MSGPHVKHHQRIAVATLKAWCGRAGYSALRLQVGYNVVEDPISVHDLHASILHQFGIDHLQLTYRFQGRDFGLTDVEGDVAKKLLPA